VANRLNHDYGQIDRDYAISLATRDPQIDGPIYMVNLMKYHEVAKYGEANGDTPRISGREADDRYNPSSILNEIGASIIFVAEVASNDCGVGDWDRIAVVRYPTRRSFIDMQSRKDFGEKHEHKAAGMSRTIISGCRPLDEKMDDRGRPTPSDLKTRNVSLILWGDNTAPAMPSHAVGFTVEGTVIGDGRVWKSAWFTSEPVDLHQSLRARPESMYALTLVPTLDGITR
jgi:hypothetical protein